MTKDEIMALFDADLVVRVIRDVKPDGPYFTGERGPFIRHDTYERFWFPLESWDDVMMIVKAMRERGWTFKLDTGTLGVAFEHLRHDDFSLRAVGFQGIDETAQRRAILQAALLAVQKG